MLSNGSNHNGKAPPVKLLLTSREAAVALSISERMLWTLAVENGEIPRVKVGTAVRYHVADLERWIERHKEQVLLAVDSA